ncbi:hypothetical protein IM793_17450 [Pedobacter sp. MR2016-19]|nr:hypothetical protein [Pedobacter sp. MR2016-19]MBE5320954.1 hypothetical protein [Pedobacter sp. MR2016-19]
MPIPGALLFIKIKRWYIQSTALIKLNPMEVSILILHQDKTDSGTTGTD